MSNFPFKKVIGIVAIVAFLFIDISLGEAFSGIKSDRASNPTFKQLTLRPPVASSFAARFGQFIKSLGQKTEPIQTIDLDTLLELCRSDFDNFQKDKKNYSSGIELAQANTKLLEEIITKLVNNFFASRNINPNTSGIAILFTGSGSDSMLISASDIDFVILRKDEIDPKLTDELGAYLSQTIPKIKNIRIVMRHFKFGGVVSKTVTDRSEYAHIADTKFVTGDEDVYGLALQDLCSSEELKEDELQVSFLLASLASRGGWDKLSVDKNITLKYAAGLPKQFNILKYVVTYLGGHLAPLRRLDSIEWLYDNGYLDNEAKDTLIKSIDMALLMRDEAYNIFPSDTNEISSEQFGLLCERLSKRNKNFEDKEEFIRVTNRAQVVLLQLISKITPILERIVRSDDSAFNNLVHNLVFETELPDNILSICANSKDDVIRAKARDTLKSRRELLLHKLIGNIDLSKCIIPFMGPASSGQTTLFKQLMADFPDSFELVIRYTERAPRPGEEDGVDYYFLNSEQFDSMLKDGKFIRVSETNGKRYGTSKEAIQKIQNENKIPILMTSGSDDKVAEVYASTEYIMVSPVSAEEFEQDKKLAEGALLNGLEASSKEQGKKFDPDDPENSSRLKKGMEVLARDIGKYPLVVKRWNQLEQAHWDFQSTIVDILVKSALAQFLANEFKIIYVEHKINGREEISNALGNAFVRFAYLYESMTGQFPDKIDPYFKTRIERLLGTELEDASTLDILEKVIFEKGPYGEIYVNDLLGTSYVVSIKEQYNYKEQNIDKLLQNPESVNLTCVDDDEWYPETIGRAKIDTLPNLISPLQGFLCVFIVPSGTGFTSVTGTISEKYPENASIVRRPTTGRGEQVGDSSNEYENLDIDTFNKLEEDGVFLNVTDIFGSKRAISTANIEEVIDAGKIGFIAMAGKDLEAVLERYGKRVVVLGMAPISVDRIRMMTDAEVKTVLRYRLTTGRRRGRPIPIDQLEQRVEDGLRKLRMMADESQFKGPVIVRRKGYKDVAVVSAIDVLNIIMQHTNDMTGNLYTEPVAVDSSL